MPRDVDLPATLRSLPYRNAIQLRSGAAFNADMDRLIQALQDNFPELPILEAPCELALDELAVPRAAIDGIRRC